MRSADSETSGWPPISNNLKQSQTISNNLKKPQTISNNLKKTQTISNNLEQPLPTQPLDHIRGKNRHRRSVDVLRCKGPPFVMTNSGCTVRDYSCMQMTSNASQDDGSWPRQDLHYISIHYPGPPTMHNPNELIFYQPAQSYLFLVVVLPTLFAQLHFLAE